MFTGIITEIGRVKEIRRIGGGVRLSITAPDAARDVHINDSVSVNGVCQTVIATSGSTFEVEAVEETLRKTTLGRLGADSPVNLELPVRLNDRLGGHLVLGHVDGVGEITKVEKQSNSWLITIAAPAEFARYLVPVGSVAVDGISLTVASLNKNEFMVSIIPHTLEKTTISAAQKGMRVNLEFDIIGKYIERLLTVEGKSETSTLNAEKLRQWGYDV
jgi:riboflavin synthase